MGVDEANVVHLVGRVSAVLDVRVLRSGDSVVPLRVVVPRPTSTGSAVSTGPRATVDVIEVACWSGATRRVAGRLEPGDHVVVDGSLHRRFFRSAGGVQSRYEVSAHRLRRCAKAGPSTRQGPPAGGQPPARGEPGRRMPGGPAERPDAIAPS